MREKIWNWGGRVSLRVLVPLSFVLLVILPVAVYSLVSYNVFQNFALNSYGNTLQESTHTLVTQMEKTLDTYEDATLTVYYGGYVDKLESGLDEVEEAELQSFLNGLCYSYSNVSAAILCAGDDIYYQGGELTVNSVVERMKEHQNELDSQMGASRWYTLDALRLRYDQSYWYVLARTLRGKDYEPIGYLYIVINSQMVSVPLNQASRGTEAIRYLVSGDGQVLYTTDRQQEENDVFLNDEDLQSKEGRSMREVGGQNALVVWQTLNNTDWKLVCAYPTAFMLNDLHPVWNVLLIFVFATFLCAVLLILVLSRVIYRPINEIITGMDQFADGNLDVTLHAYLVREVYQLSTHFNSMSTNMRRLLRDNETQQREKNEYKIKALLAQLNPHFIYNTLNTIKWMAAIARQTKIQNTTESLMKILMSVTKKQGVYRISDEIELIHNYAEIQKVRFSNFDLIWKVEPEACACSIPVYIIQPVVENAIVHGLGRGKRLDGIIQVEIWLDDALHIQVSDNGCGFDVEKWRAQGHAAEGDHLHIGIHNIEQIIQLEYGSGYGLRVESQPDAGTQVHYLLPIRKEA